MSLFKFKKSIASALGSMVNFDRLINIRQDCYVLSYHRVLTIQQAQNEGVHHSMWITPERFESQIRWMKSIGEIVDCFSLIGSSIPSHRPLFALTLDDGWKDNYDNALPILIKHQVSAHIFLVSEAVENGFLFWPQDISTKTMRLLNKGHSKQVVSALLECWPERTHACRAEKTCVMEMVDLWIEALKMVDEFERKHRIDDYYRRLKLSTSPLTGYILSWDEARKMQNHGVSFGSHTHRHTILEGLSDDQIEKELKQSKLIIADRLQSEVKSFCYPNGRYSGQEGEILSRCGFHYGFRLDNMSMRQCVDNFYIPRFLVSERKAANASYFKMCLLEVPLYRSKPHKLIMEKT